MLVSLCIPCRNRLDDLVLTMPRLVEIANLAGQVEITLVDYGSTEDIWTPLQKNDFKFKNGSLFTGMRIEMDYYHMAHARNLSVKISHGEIVVILSADIYLSPNYIPIIRDLFEHWGNVWIRANKYQGVVAVRRDEFIAAGGYDERFEFYGPEDRDLAARLTRRLGEPIILEDGLIHIFETPNEKKILGYRLPLTKSEMSQLMRPIFEENEARQILVANEGKEWGKW